MANTIGQLLVELGINSINFHGGIDKATYAAKQFGADLKRSFSEVGNQFSQLGATLGASFGPLGGVLDGVVRGLTGVGSAVSAAGKGVPALTAVAGAAAGIGGAAIAAAIGWEQMSDAGNKVVEELSHMHDKLGISIADLQVLKALGDPVGVSGETMAKGFRTFEKALADNTGRMSSAKIALHNLGVTAKDPQKAFEQAAEAISKVEDPTVRMAYATALFSRAGVQMLPVLMRGKEGIDEARLAVEKFGPVIGKEAVDAMHRNEAATEELSLAWDKAKVQSVTPFFASIKEGIAGALSGMADFMKAAHAMGQFSTYSGASDEEGKKDKAAQKTKDDLRAKQDGINAALKLQFETLKAGGAEERKLVDLQNSLAEAMAEGEAIDWKGVLNIQEKIKGQQILADMEKKANEDEKRQREALLDINKRNKADFTKTKDVYGNEVSIRRDALARQEVAKQKEKDAEEEQKLLDGIQDTFEKNARERMTLIEIEHLKTIGNTEREMASKRTSAREQVSGQAALGVIVKKEEQQQMLAIEQKELADYVKLNDEKLVVLREFLEAQKSIQAGKGGAGADIDADRNASRAQEAFNQAQTEGRDRTDALTNSINREKVALAKNPFTEFIKSTKDVKTAIETNIVQALDGVSKGLAHSIVVGGSFTKSMRQVGEQAAESFVAMEIKRLMAHVMTETGLTAATVTGNAARGTSDRIAAGESILKSAKTAAAKGFDAGMKFPFPMDLVMAPVLAAGAFAGVMAFDAFEQGGIVGHTGMAQLHKNEMVLPAPIAEKVTKMSDPESGQGRGMTVNNNFKIATPNADSFRRSQSQIDAKAHASSTKAMRQNGGRA